MGNPFDQFDRPASGNPFDQFDDLNQKQEPRSAIGEILNQGKAGIVSDLPRMGGQALQYASDPGNPLYEFGKGIADFGTAQGERPDLQAQPDQHNALTNALAGGARMIPQSIAPAAAVGLGLASLPVSAPVALGIAGALGSIPAAMSQGQETLDKARKAGIAESDALKAARINAGIEWGGETVGTIAGGKLLGIGGKALSKVAGRTAGQGAGNALSEMVSPGIVKPFLRELSKTAAVETGTEMGQNYGESAIEKAYGIDNKSPTEAALEAIGPTLGMTALLAPFGLAGFANNARSARKVASALESKETAPEQRAQLAKAYADELSKIDPVAAENFKANTNEAILGIQPITIDEGLFSAPQGTPPATPPVVEQTLPNTGPLSGAVNVGIASGATSLEPVLRERNFVPPPSGSYGQLSEFENLLNSERADKQSRVSDLLSGQAMKAASEAETQQARVEAAQQQQSAQARYNLLQQVAETLPADRNLKRAFGRALKEAGYSNLDFTPEETASIDNFNQINRGAGIAANIGPEIIPSVPNELDASQFIKEKGAKPEPKRHASNLVNRIHELELIEEQDGLSTQQASEMRGLISQLDAQVAAKKKGIAAPTQTFGAQPTRTTPLLQTATNLGLPNVAKTAQTVKAETQGKTEQQPAAAIEQPKLPPVISSNTAVDTEQDGPGRSAQIKSYPKKTAVSVASMMTKNGSPTEAYPHPSGDGTYALRVPGSGSEATPKETAPNSQAIPDRSTPQDAAGVKPNSSATLTSSPELETAKKNYKSAIDGRHAARERISAAKTDLEIADAKNALDAIYDASVRLDAAVTSEVERKANDGEMSVFKGKNLTYAVHPATDGQSAWQVTTYSDSGALGDTRYQTLEQAIKDARVSQYDLLDSEAANAEMERLAKAEGEYQDRKNAKPTTQKASPAQAQQTRSNVAPIMRRNDLVGAIMRVTGGNGIASSMSDTLIGEKANKAGNLRGLFTNRGQQDMGDIAMLLREEEGFDVKDGPHLEELIREASSGNVAKSMAAQEEEKAINAEKEHRQNIRDEAARLGIKSAFKKFDILEREVLARQAEEAQAAQSEAEAERAAIQAESAVKKIDDDQVNELLQLAVEDGRMIGNEWITNEEILAGFDATTAIGEREDEAGASRTGEDSAREAAGNSQEGSGQARAEVAPALTLEGQTLTEVNAQEKKRQADEAAAQRDDAPKGPNVTADQVDLFNTQGGLFNSNRDSQEEKAQKPEQTTAQQPESKEAPKQESKPEPIPPANDAIYAAIPPAFIGRTTVTVQHLVNGSLKPVEMNAKDAIKEADQEIEGFQALLDCIRSAA